MSVYVCLCVNVCECCECVCVCVGLVRVCVCARLDVVESALNLVCVVFVFKGI